MPSRVAVEIDTQANVTGIQKLITETRQLYKETSASITAVADRAAATRGIEELNRKAGEIEQKIARTRLDQVQGGFGPAAGPGYLEKLRSDLEQTNLERQIRQFDVAQAGQGMLPTAMRGGQFVAGKALRMGGAVAGLMGAYSLFSGVSQRMGTAEEKNMAYAMALSAARVRNQPDILETDPNILESRAAFTQKYGLDYTTQKPFFEVKEILDELGDTAFMTSKDMIPLLNVTKELGDFSKRQSAELIKVANIGKSLGVDTGALGELFTGGLQMGTFQRGGRYADMATMLMLNQNMMHRATETIQAMGQVISGTIHGTQGLEASGMFNLMQTLNESPFLAYRGRGGGQAMLRIDQAFRGGGNENLQYFQALALSPAFQEINARRLQDFNALGQGGPTNFGTGRYDQLIADVFQELGAFATAGGVSEQLSQMGFGGAAAYVTERYGDMGKMNIERLFEQYRGAYGAGDEGRRFFMTSQMAKDLGVGFADIGVLNEALQDKRFLIRAGEKGLGLGASAEAYRKWQESGGKFPEMEKYMTKKTTTEDLLQKIADDIKSMADKSLPVTIRILSKIESFTAQTSNAVDSVVDFCSGAKKRPSGTVELGQYTEDPWGTFKLDMSQAMEKSLYDVRHPGETITRDISDLGELVTNMGTLAKAISSYLNTVPIIEGARSPLNINLSGLPGATIIDDKPE